MDVADLLTRARDLGVVLALDGAVLRVTGPRAALTPALASALAAHRPDVRRALGAPWGPASGYAGCCTWCPVCRTERVAIRVFDDVARREVTRAA